jgi:hypothetical protein
MRTFDAELHDAHGWSVSTSGDKRWHGVELRDEWQMHLAAQALDQPWTSLGPGNGPIP